MTKPLIATVAISLLVGCASDAPATIREGPPIVSIGDMTPTMRGGIAYCVPARALRA